jgi:hypothetical protein
MGSGQTPSCDFRNISSDTQGVCRRSPRRLRARPSRRNLALCRVSKGGKRLVHSSDQDTEIADVTENLLKTGGSFSLPQLLNNPAVLPYFRSLSVEMLPPVSDMCANTSPRLATSLTLGPRDQLIRPLAANTSSSRSPYRRSLLPRRSSSLSRASFSLSTPLRAPVGISHCSRVCVRRHGPSSASGATNSTQSSVQMQSARRRRPSKRRARMRRPRSGRPSRSASRD